MLRAGKAVACSGPDGVRAAGAFRARGDGPLTLSVCLRRKPQTSFAATGTAVTPQAGRVFRQWWGWRSICAVPGGGRCPLLALGLRPLLRSSGAVADPAGGSRRWADTLRRAPFPAGAYPSPCPAPALARIVLAVPGYILGYLWTRIAQEFVRCKRCCFLVLVW